MNTYSIKPMMPKTILVPALFVLLLVELALPHSTLAQTGLNDLNVQAYGAVPNGVTDDTAAFQNAIAAAESGTNNGIYVPMGNYVISSTLTLSNIEMVGKFVGGWPADNMPMPTLLINQVTAPGITLQNGASVHGVAIGYKTTPATTNAPAISLQGGGITLSSVRIQDPYDGITTPVSAAPNRARFSDIFIVQPVHIGLQISKCSDFVQFNHIEVWCNTAFSTGPGFDFGSIAGGTFNGLLGYQCTPGIQIYNDTSVANSTFTGDFVNCCMDASTTGININGNQQVKITAGDWDCEFWGAVINGASAQVSIVGGKWHANSQEAIMVTQAQNVLIDSCIFYRSTPYGAGWTNNPLVWVSNATSATVNGCQFMPGSTGLELDSQVQNALVVGNSFQAGGIVNNMTSTNYVITNNLLP
jgi:Pectate lyase superfamily protein